MRSACMFILVLPSVVGEYLVGRVREGQYEYPRLNGFLTPQVAQLMCDRDKMCGGFTYKGYIGAEDKQEIFFFHLILNFVGGVDGWSWVTYRPADRRLVQFSAIPNSTVDSWENQAVKAFTHFYPSSEQGVEKCEGLGESCAGVVTKRETGESVLVGNINFDEMVVSDMYLTFVKLDNIDVGKAVVPSMDGLDSYGKIDRCCSKQEFDEETETKLKKWYPRTNDIKRVPCTISQDKFEAEYVRKNRPAILTGCSKNWRTQSDWSIMSLLGLEDGEKEWFTEYLIDSEDL